MLIEERRTVKEAYTSAMASSNLKLDAERRGDADVLIAAGLSPVRIGSALLRLHTEFDRVARAPLATTAGFAPARPTKEQKAEAAQRAHAHNLHETALMLGRLKTLPEVRAALVLQVGKWGTEASETVVAEVLRWWLRPICAACGGTKFEVVPGTGRHSARACKGCRGTGLAPLPCGQNGRRLANYLDDCVARAQAGIRKRLHPVASAA